MMSPHNPRIPTRKAGQRLSLRPTVGYLAAFAALLTAFVLTVGPSAPMLNDRQLKDNQADTFAGESPVSEAPAIDQRLDELRADYPVPGALAYVRVGNHAWFGSSGVASIAPTPIHVESTFRIGSITKPIVAALVLDAHNRGEIDIDTPVEALVPELAHPDAPVSVRMLLAHTSGVFDEGNEGDPIADVDMLADPGLLREAASLADQHRAGEAAIASDRLIISLAETHDRYFPPGSGFHYSNVNYQIATRALESATGKPLSRLLHQRLATPLGLERTWMTPPDLQPPDLRGYEVSDDALHDVTDGLLAFGNGGNGGVTSTAPELATMLQHIVAGDLFGTDVTNTMATQTPQSGGTYGLGLARYELTCGTFYGHAGSVAGTHSIALVSADAARVVIVAINGRTGEDPQLLYVADDLVCTGGHDVADTLATDP